MPKNILVIDSEMATRDALTLMLSHTRYQLRVAGSVSQAMKIVWAKAPDVILLDVHIKELDLKDFTSEALRMNENVCIIGLSHKAKLGESHRKLLNHHLKKPFTQIHVLRILEQCLADRNGDHHNGKNHLA